MEQRPATIKIGELGLIAFLAIRDIYPVDRTGENSRYKLCYEESAALDDAMIVYQKCCPVCGFAPIEFMRAHAESRRMLLDGNLDRTR